MRRLITVSCLAIFLAFFMIASVIYFNRVAHPPQPEIDSILKIALLAVAGGIALSQFFYQFQIIQIDRIAIRAALGAALGVVLFSVVFFSENIMSTIQLTRAMRDPEVFSVVNGHCGVYSGRGLVRWYQLSIDPSIENRMNAFLFSNQCRIEHFMDLRGRQQLPCQGDEDSLSCLSRWMLTFSKKGYWNYPTRKMFFEEAQRGVIKASDSDVDKKWITFVLSDFDLDKSRPPLAQQAGIDEDFNDVHHYFKLKDEYDNLKLTQEEFALTEKFIHEEKSPSVEIVKFKEVRKEVNLKLEKIPELEENLKTLEAKLKADGYAGLGQL